MRIQVFPHHIILISTRDCHQDLLQPCEASIVAALNPAEVDYLFFVLTGEDGTHTFSTTYEEHLRANQSDKGLMT